MEMLYRVHVADKKKKNNNRGQIVHDPILSSLNQSDLKMGDEKCHICLVKVGKAVGSAFVWLHSDKTMGSSNKSLTQSSNKNPHPTTHSYLPQSAHRL